MISGCPNCGEMSSDAAMVCSESGVWHCGCYYGEGAANFWNDPWAHFGGAHGLERWLQELPLLAWAWRRDRSTPPPTRSEHWAAIWQREINGC